MGKMGTLLGLGLLAAWVGSAPAALAQDALIIRCHAVDMAKQTFYSSAPFAGDEANLDGDYIAFVSALKRRYGVSVDEEMGLCFSDASRSGAAARVENAWIPFRDKGGRRVDTGWKPERVTN